MSDETLVDYFNALSRDLPRENEKKYKNPQSG